MKESVHEREEIERVHERGKERKKEREKGKCM
jgi:hypothetical protein